jgi:hypothetical protein
VRDSFSPWLDARALANRQVEAKRHARAQNPLFLVGIVHDDDDEKEQGREEGGGGREGRRDGERVREAGKEGERERG